MAQDSGEASNDTSPAPQSAKAYLQSAKLPLLNTWIAVLLFIIVVDGLPAVIPGHKRVKELMDAALDKSGLWQGSWQLFAPNPDNLNAWIEAKVTFSDGSKWSWTSPDWSNRSLFQKFIQGRHPKWTDNFRMDRNKGIWPYLTDYVARIAPRPGPDVWPTRVSLIRHWWDVPKPQDLDEERQKYSRIPPPRDKFPHEKQYYTKRYKRPPATDNGTNGGTE